MNSRIEYRWSAFVCIIVAAGCGNSQTETGVSSNPPTTETATSEMGASTADMELSIPEISLKTASLDVTEPQVEKVAATSASKSPVKGPQMESTAWCLEQIAKLRSAPLDVVRAPIPGQRDQFQTVKLSPEQVQVEKVRRQKVIATLAQQVIGKTHSDTEKLNEFNNAVVALSEARLQLALAGDDQQAQLLYNDAQSLFKKDPESFAAVESAFKMLQLTQQEAQRSSVDNVKWAKAFAQQTRMFTQNFPNEDGRAAIHLIEAGDLCIERQLPEEALNCLTMVQTRYPETPFAKQVEGTVRRLRLSGQALTEFGGSTIDGSFVS